MRQFDELEKMDDQVGVLKEHILNYLGDVHKRELTEKQRQRLFLMIKSLEEVERIADTVRSDLVPLGRTAHEKAIETTETTRHIFTTLYERVSDAVRKSRAAVKDLDQNKALEVINMKTEVNGLINEALDYQAMRVAPTTPDLITTFRMEDEFIDALQRIYRLTR